MIGDKYMPEFDKQALEHLKKLCRIDCGGEEEADILHSLKRILEFVRELDEVPTENVKSCNYLTNGLPNNWREDVSEMAMPRDQFLANAPDKIAGMIRVPPVLKRNEKSPPSISSRTKRCIQKRRGYCGGDCRAFPQADRKAWEDAWRILNCFRP